MGLNYSELSDNEIIKLIAKKDDDAMDFMMNKYGGIVKKECRTMYIIGAEAEDLMQEGMIGLFKAIRDYADNKGASFSTFATLCVKRQLQTAINNSNRQKHQPLNSYISIYLEKDENGYNIADDIKCGDVEINPEKLAIIKEENKHMAKRIDEELSDYEKEVVKYYLDGLSYNDIGQKLGKTGKSIDNALQRIRTKLSR